MRTVQMTLDDTLVQEIDHVVKQLGTTPSAFARDALRAALAQVRRQEREQKHREEYARRPVTPGEFSDWEDEQVWVESALHKKSFLAVLMGKNRSIRSRKMFRMKPKSSY